MGSLFSSPAKPPPIPVPPPAAAPATAANAGQDAAASKGRSKAAKMYGSTVATSPQGLLEPPKTAYATLLGGTK